MFVAKPHKFGKPAELDGSGNQVDVQNLADEADTNLLLAIDNQPFNNPDAAGMGMGVSAIPNFMGGRPLAPMRSENTGGTGMVHPTAQSAAPKGSPFGSPSNFVRTTPRSIDV